jgi:putative surface-exposed virulence protein
MCSHVRAIMYASMIALLTLASAFSVIPARADDGAPPPPASPGSPAVAVAGTTKILFPVAAGTDVVVVNRSGHKVALASQEAAHIIAAGDPIWCPLGVLPKPSLVGPCSPAQTGFSDLESWLSSYSGTPKAGVIWIQDSYTSSTNASDSLIHSFTLNGTALAGFSLYSLTIKGGWNGTSGSTITTPDETEFDNASLSVIDWHAAVTISDIIVTRVTVPSSDSYALSVSTDKGGITLNRVEVMDNYPFAAGAHLDTHGAAVGHPAPVTVTDGMFNNNYGTGLQIDSNGAVLIRNLTADNNGGPSTFGYGANINNWWTNPDQPVTLTGTNEFTKNYGSGLWIESFGVVTLNNITAYQNTYTPSIGYGVHINNAHGPTLTTTPSNVVITGTNLFAFNKQDGLFINTNGNIILNNITSTYNTGNGAYLENCLRTALTVCPTTAKTVTLTGVNAFNHNNSDGLDVDSSGTITISQVAANHNNGFGAYLVNCAIGSGGSCMTPLPYNVTLTKASTFIGNSGSTGLFIDATGTVSLNNITASFNGAYGALIYNNAHLLTPRSVTITGTNVFNANSSSGLDVYSYGAITVSNLTANANGQVGLGGNGVWLDNRGYDPNVGIPGTGGDTVITRMPVTLTGINNFNLNYSDGLDIFSAGAISVANVSASDNGTAGIGDGIYLYNNDNWYPNFGAQKYYAANVTVSGFGFSEANVNFGLGVNSAGSVNLANITANDNGSDGAHIDASGWLAPQSVTLTGLNTFNHNGIPSGNGSGLYIKNDGKITISNLSASLNKADGAYLDNFSLGYTWPGKFAGVTLTGFNTFQQNQGSYGLYIYTDGSATMSHVIADENTAGTGVYVKATKAITVTCGYAEFNTTGLDLSTGTTLTITGVHAYYNTGDDTIFNVPPAHITYACP